MIFTGFSFNGTHCGDFGITAKSVSRPILPRVKEFTASPAVFDGELDFSRDKLGDKRFEPVVIEILLQIAARDLADLQSRLSAAAAWLLPDGALRFDDMPGVYWRARCNLGLSYSPQAGGRAAAVTAHFRCEPFAYADAEVSVTLPFGGGNFAGEGTYFSSPQIFVSAPEPAKTFQITLNGAALNYLAPSAFTQLFIDCASASARTGTTTGAGGTDSSGGLSGEYPKIRPGANSVSVSAEGARGALAVSAVLRYVPRYVYGKIL